MFDFIIDMIADIAEIFVDLWVNKVIDREKKSNINSNHVALSVMTWKGMEQYIDTASEPMYNSDTYIVSEYN